MLSFCFLFLQEDTWKLDRIPEIMDGKNVADYVDEDIDAKLALLEQEEDQLQVRYDNIYDGRFKTLSLAECRTYLYVTRSVRREKS